MNLHEIIHAYLILSPQAGHAWLQSLVRDGGLNPMLVKYIIGVRS